MKSGYRWSGRVLGSLLAVAVTAPIAHAQQQETSPELPAETGESGPAGAPVIVDGHSFAGQHGANSSGAIGRFSYIQIAGSVSIYNRHSHAVIATGTLNELSGNPSWARSHDAHIIWDATTNRFYYAMFAETGEPKISFGFSKTPHPTTISSADWCHYGWRPALTPTIVLSSPKLGDSKDFLIIGFHYFKPERLGSSTTEPSIFAVAKPPAGTTCPDAATLKYRWSILRDASGALVWAPMPSNQVDDEEVGYVVARNRSLPSNKLWFFSVSKDADGFPTVGPDVP